MDICAYRVLVSMLTVNIVAGGVYYLCNGPDCVLVVIFQRVAVREGKNQNNSVLFERRLILFF